MSKGDKDTASPAVVEVVVEVEVSGASRAPTREVEAEARRAKARNPM